MYRVTLSSFPNSELRAVLSLVGRRAALPLGVLPTPSPEVESEQSPALPSLPLTLDSNSRKSPETSKGRQNRRRFTLSAKRKILRAGGALDRYDPVPSNSLFLTGTLPGSTEHAKQAICDRASWIVHRLKDWLRSLGCSAPLSFYCWELQKRGALHLHYCVHVPDQAIAQRVVDGFKVAWIRLLKRAGKLQGVDMFARSSGGTWDGKYSVVQAYAKPVRSSVAAYLSKYVGKATGKGPHRYAPKRWSGVSRPLTSLIEEYSCTVAREYPSYRGALQALSATAQEVGATAHRTYCYHHGWGSGSTHVSFFKGNLEEQEICYQRGLQTLSCASFSRKRSVTQDSRTGLPSWWKTAISFLRETSARFLKSALPHLGSSIGFLVGHLTSLVLVAEHGSLKPFSIQSDRKTMNLLSDIPLNTAIGLMTFPKAESFRLVIRHLWEQVEGRASLKHDRECKDSLQKSIEWDRVGCTIGTSERPTEGLGVGSTPTQMLLAI